MKPLDIGWFAKKDVFQYRRPDPPEFGAGGDAFLESTPPVLTYYQARAGQLFTLAIGVDRLREYSLRQPRRPGAASRWARARGGRGVVCDPRGPWLRLCPDVLTRAAEIDRAAETVAEVMRS